MASWLLHSLAGSGEPPFPLEDGEGFHIAGPSIVLGSWVHSSRALAGEPQLVEFGTPWICSTSLSYIYSAAGWVAWRLVQGLQILETHCQYCHMGTFQDQGRTG